MRNGSKSTSGLIYHRNALCLLLYWYTFISVIDLKTACLLTNQGKNMMGFTHKYFTNELYILFLFRLCP